MSVSIEDPFSTLEAVKAYSEKTSLFPAEEEIIRRHLKPGGLVIELGCGTGRVAAHLDKMGFDVVGLDCSYNMVLKAKALHPGIPFIWGDACDMDFEDGQFDAAMFCFNGIDYIHPEERRLKAINEIRRVLKPDGVFAFSSHNRLWLYLPTRRRLRKISHHEGPYYVEKTSYGDLVTHFITPMNQARQLKENGFRQEARYGWYNESWIYYVARRIAP